MKMQFRLEQTFLRLPRIQNSMKTKCMGYSDPATCYCQTKSRGSFVTVFKSRSTFTETCAKSSTWGGHYGCMTKTSWSCRHLHKIFITKRHHTSIICSITKSIGGRQVIIATELLPFVTDHFCSCVCVCQEHLWSRSGDACLNTCMIRRTRSIFVLLHTDCFLFWPIFIVLAWECVTGRWRGLQAMHIWIHVTIYFFWAAYRLLSFLTDHFFSCVCMCHGQLNRRSGDAFLNICIIRRA